MLDLLQLKRYALVMVYALCFTLPTQAQQTNLSAPRKAVRISGDVVVGTLAAAGVAAVLAQKDWQGLKQGALAGVTTVGVSLALKYIVKEERPDHSNKHSFPSMHTSTAFTAAAFIQRRYGWKWGAPAYALSTYVGWTRAFARKHHWWDVLAGAAIGTASSYIFTTPFARKHELVIAPFTEYGKYGLHAAMKF